MGGGTELSELATAYIREKLKRGEWGRSSSRMPRHALRGLCTSFGKRPVRQLGEHAIGKWLESTAHMAAATRRNMLGAVRGFCRWLVRRKHLRSDPTVDIARIRQPRTVVVTVSRDERNALWEVCENNRDRALFGLLYVLGLRCCEVSRLKVEDWDRRNNLLVVTGKGGHEREVPVIEHTAGLLRAWIAEDPRSTGPMFPSFRGGALKPATIGDRVRYLMYQGGVKDRPFDGKSAHALRRTAATETLKASGDLRSVKDMLGHADWSSMKHYQARAETSEIAAALTLRFAEDLPPAA